MLQQVPLPALKTLFSLQISPSPIQIADAQEEQLNIQTLSTNATRNTKKDGMQSYVERKEQMKAINRTKKAIAATEKKIESMEIRLKELDDLLCDPKNASDMTMVNEYKDIKRNIDVEIEKWEKLSEELESLSASL